MNEVSIHFDVTDYTGQQSISSYALPFCEFVFTLDYDSITESNLLSDQQILWDYGDGTTSTNHIGKHAYSAPGNYTVTCYLFDNQNNAYLNTYAREIIIKDYLTSKIQLSTTAPELSVIAGKITGPINVTATTSINDEDIINNTIIATASGYNLPQNYFDINNTPYKHLNSYFSFYIKKLTRSGTYEFAETETIPINYTPIYCKLSNTEIVLSNSNDNDSIICGLSGFQQVFFKTDISNNALSALLSAAPKTPTNLLFGFQNDIVNYPMVGLSCYTIPNIDYNNLSITSNGVDGEYIPISSFNLTHNKFIDQQINFLIKVKDSEWYTIKDLTITDFSINAKKTIYSTSLTSTSQADLNSTIVITSSSDSYIQGYITPLEFANDVTLAADVTITSNYISTPITLSVISDTFNVLGYVDGFFITEQNQIIKTSSIYDITKQNENIDMFEKYKLLETQPVFNNVPKLNEALCVIVGDLSSSQTSLGKSIYEKIANFIDNNADINKCNIQQLLSILKSINEENLKFEKINFSYPASFKRLIDLLSIKFSYLHGFENTFDLDFKSYGTQTYGKNLGNKIDTLSYIITAGVPIVAYEKYSETFKKVNTYTPRLSVYPLSTYSHDWGWGLLLNNNFTPYDIKKYYTFFEFQTASTPKTSILVNPAPTTYTEWVNDNGHIENILSYQLSKGLQLIPSTFSNIPLTAFTPGADIPDPEPEPEPELTLITTPIISTWA